MKSIVSIFLIMEIIMIIEVSLFLSISYDFGKKLFGEQRKSFFPLISYERFAMYFYEIMVGLLEKDKPTKLKKRKKLKKKYTQQIHELEKIRSKR